MKSINVISNYTAYIEKNLKKLSKLILKKKYSENNFSSLLDIYIKTRYYDSLQRRNKSPYHNTKSYVKDELNKLKQKEVLEPVLKIYGEVLNFDHDDLNAKEFLNNIEKYLTELEIDIKTIEPEIIELCSSIKAKKQEVKRIFKCKDFACRYKNTNLNKVYIVDLDYNFSIPKLYSDFAVDKVYTSGTINEDKLYVEYYLVLSRLLNEIINFDYSNNYVVDFSGSLIAKDNKLNNLLTLISNEICKEKISLKLNYADFNQNKDKVMKYINEGYNFAFIVDETYEDKTETRKLITSIFKYIVISSGDKNIEIFKKCSNLIKIK